MRIFLIWAWTVWSTSWQFVGLTPLATSSTWFSAVELNLPILASSEEQQAKLKKDYEKRINDLKLCDPLSISQSKRTDDISKWPKIDLGCIFGYILKVKDLILIMLEGTRIRKHIHILTVVLLISCIHMKSRIIKLSLYMPMSKHQWKLCYFVVWTEKDFFYKKSNTITNTGKRLKEIYPSFLRVMCVLYCCNYVF